MDWMEHEDPTCVGDWRFSRRSQCYYCIVCQGFHFLSDWSRRAYANWSWVDRVLNNMTRCP